MKFAELVGPVGLHLVIMECENSNYDPQVNVRMLQFQKHL